MTCIAVVSLKGGTGKTTLSAHLARGLQLHRHTAAVLDIDPQRSALDWGAASGDALVDVIEGHQSDAALKTQISELSGELDALVIDGAPHAIELTRVVIRAAELVLIPIGPSPLDIWAVDDLVKIVKQEKRRRRRLRAAFVLWRMIPRTKIVEASVNALEKKLPILPTRIHQRVSYAAAMIEGKTVLDTARTSPAAGEIRALIKDIEAL